MYRNGATTSTLVWTQQTQERQSGFNPEAGRGKGREGLRAVSDRTASIQLLGKPGNKATIQVYAPTTEAEEDETESF